MSISARSQKRFYKTRRGNQPKVEVDVSVSATGKPRGGPYDPFVPQTVEITLFYGYELPKSAGWNSRRRWVSEHLELELDPAQARALGEQLIDSATPEKKPARRKK